MSSSVSSPLRYVLSTTMLTVQTALRLAVAADGKGGHLEPEVVVSLASRARPMPAVSARRPAVRSKGSSLAAEGSLRKAFDKAHPRTAALAADLSARAEQYLAGLRMGENAAEVLTFGQALEVVHRELAGADRMRREWIAGQGRELAAATWDLCRDDLVRVEGTPRSLPADLALPTEDAGALAAEYGVLVALLDVDTDGRGRAPSTIAVYRRSPASLPEGFTAADDQTWQRDDVLSRLHLVDDDEAVTAASEARVPYPRSGDGGWSPAWSPAPAEPVGWAPEAALEAMAVARCQLELLEGSDEYARLAATHERAAELLALEHEARLADGRARRG